MSYAQRIFDVDAARACKARQKQRHKVRYDYGDVLESEVAAMWTVLSDFEFLERYLHMSIWDDVFGVAGKVDAESVLEDSGFSKQYPVLAAMLTETPTINGRRRKVCTLTIVCEDGQAKGGLKDRDRDLSLWVSCPSIGGLLAALEEALNERPVSWRRITNERFKATRKDS